MENEKKSISKGGCKESDIGIERNSKSVGTYQWNKLPGQVSEIIYKMKSVLSIGKNQCSNCDKAF